MSVQDENNGMPPPREVSVPSVYVQPGQDPQQEVSSTQKNVDIVGQHLEGVNIATSAPVLNPSTNFDEIIAEVKESYELIGSCSSSTIELVKNLEQRFLSYNTTALSVRQQILYTKEVNSLTTAIQAKLQEFQTPSQPIQNQQVTPQEQPSSKAQDVIMNNDVMKKLTAPTKKTSQVVEYHHLHQYISDMLQNVVNNTSKRLQPEAFKQMQEFNDYSVRLDVNKYKNSPLREIFACKGNVWMQRHQLKKSQCEYIQRLISSEGNRTISANQDFPQFNPDFMFPWSIIFVQLSEQHIWNEFVGQHRESQMTLPQNKTVPEIQIKAKFAFNQGCRWIRVLFDKRMNMTIGERDLFCITNGYSPNYASRVEVSARCFCLRDKNTGAADGESAFIYAADEARFIKAYNRWNHVSPFLKFGNFQVQILRAQALPNLPKDLPSPLQYEQVLQTHCGWINLSKSQLVSHLQAKFCPCIGFGGIYLPKYSHSQFCVTGKLINMTPRFAGTVPENDFEKYFQWCTVEGKWIPYEKPLNEAPLYEEYTSQVVPSLVDQNVSHQDSQIFEEQTLDPVNSPIYGSMHFWSWYQRDQPLNQISLTPMSPFSKFSEGFDPFKPKAQDDPIIFHLLNPQANVTKEIKDASFAEYISTLSTSCMELNLRYKRCNMIKGYNSPYLYYEDMARNNENYNDGKYIRSRIPLSLELLQMPVTVEALKNFSKFDISNFHWVPKALVQHIDEDSNTYWPHAKDLAKERYNRSQTKRPNDNFLPVNKKPKTYTTYYRS